MGEARLPADVRARLGREFAGESFFEALRLLETLGQPGRVTRAVVFLAAGNFDDLRLYARQAERDWRDVVFWAEYQDHESDAPRHVRSMEDPFPDPID
ncbi:MAG: hypothetical protein AAF430_06030 [Myxococcota bacterium]